MKYSLFIVVFSIILSGCAIVNKNPDILLDESYQNVRYIADPDKSHQALDVVQVTTRGLQANILNTIPQLYKKALERSDIKKQVQIGNITISSFTKKENFQVSYQECVSNPRTESVPQTSCYSGTCSTRYTTQTRYVQECRTRYRTEIRNVLYQKATADILVPKRRM